MTDNPLTQLRQQLVAAGDRRAQQRPADAPVRSTLRARRRGAWLALAALLVAAPAGATAAGILEFGTSGTTPDGSSYSVARIELSSASRRRAPT